MNVKPLSDRVLILPNPAEEKTAGGLYIPDTAKEKPLAGKVGKYAGTEIQVEGESYLIMRQSDILAII